MKQKNDFSVFQKFEFERPPVGIKFLLDKPEGIPKAQRKKVVLPYAARST